MGEATDLSEVKCLPRVLILCDTQAEVSTIILTWNSSFATIVSLKFDICPWTCPNFYKYIKKKDNSFSCFPEFTSIICVVLLFNFYWGQLIACVIDTAKAKLKTNAKHTHKLINKWIIKWINVVFKMNFHLRSHFAEWGHRFVCYSSLLWPNLLEATVLF